MMKRTVFFVWLLSVSLLSTGLAITPQELIQKNRQALSSNQESLFNLSTIRMVGQIEKYGLQGNVGIFVALPERFSMVHEFSLFSEKWVARDKEAEILDMTGWRRAAARGDLFHLRALQFILGLQYLNPDMAPPTDIREADGEVSDAAHNRRSPDSSGLQCRQLSPPQLRLHRGGRTGCGHAD